MVSILGGAPRRLRGDAFGAEISPDDALVTFGNDSGIWIAESDGEAPRQFLADTDDESLRFQKWSWRGDRIVYGRWVRHGNRWDFSIESRDLEGGSLTTLVGGRRLQPQFLMVKDRLVFVRREPFPRQRDQNLWEVTVDARTGQPVGEPRRLTDWADFGFAQLSATRDGRQLVFIKRRGQSDVYVGDIEEGGRSLTGTRRLSLHDLSDWAGAWTPDGQAVVFTSNRNGTNDIFRQGLEQRTASVEVSGPRNLFGPRLTPDGGSFLYWSRARQPDDDEQEQAEPDDSRRLMRIPVSGGPMETVLETSGWASVSCSSAPDGGCVLIERDRDNRRDTLYRLDPVQGKGDELFGLDYDRETDPFWRLSPDGQRLVLVNDAKDDRTIGVFDLAGKLVEEISLQGLPGATLDEIAWSASGRGFFAILDSPRGEILAFVEPTGRTHMFEQAQSGGFEDLRPSPDGRHLAYSRFTVDRNVWTIDEF